MTDTTAEHPSAGKLRLRRPPLWLVSTAVVIAGWEVASFLLGNDAAGEPTLPGITDVATAFRGLANYWPGGLGVKSTQLGGKATLEAATLGLIYNSGISLLRMAGGLLLGGFVGIALAVAVSWSRAARDALSAPAHFARMSPLLAMVPLFSLWFGNTTKGAIFFVAFSTFVLIFGSAIVAIGTVPRYYVLYSRSLGATSLRTYLRVVLPAALPRLRGGILLAVGYSWSAVIAAEFLGQQYGLGRIVIVSQQFGHMSMLALTGFFAVLYAATSYLLIERLLRRVTRWA